MQEINSVVGKYSLCINIASGIHVKFNNTFTSKVDSALPLETNYENRVFPYPFQAFQNIFLSSSSFKNFCCLVISNVTSCQLEGPLMKMYGRNREESVVWLLLLCTPFPLVNSETASCHALSLILHFMCVSLTE